MRTNSRIFATLFLALGVFAAGAAIYGATHQWFIAGICAAIAFALLADAGKKIDANEKVNL